MKSFFLILLLCSSVSMAAPFHAVKYWSDIPLDQKIKNGWGVPVPDTLLYREQFYNDKYSGDLKKLREEFISQGFTIIEGDENNAEVKKILEDFKTQDKEWQKQKK